MIKECYKALNKIRHAIFGWPYLRDVNNGAARGLKKSALLVYLTKPFILDQSDPVFLMHQNFSYNRLLASVLDQFGFIVDVVEYQDTHVKPKKKYDLLLTHRLDYGKRGGYFKAIPNKIYLCSGSNHLVHNRNLKIRMEGVHKRRGIHLNDVVWDTEDLSYLEEINAICGPGNATIKSSWRENYHGPIYMHNNIAILQRTAVDRNYDSAKKRYLFFGSGQQLNKGLDLLLEVFRKNPQMELYVCSNYLEEKDFCDCFHNELYNTPNIHAMGWVSIKGDTFREIVKKCAFVILPSCSEGQPGSVINCMATGLIPIVTPQCGIDVDDFGIIIEDIQIDAIEKLCRNLSAMPNSKLKLMSNDSQKAISTKYTIELLEKSIRHFLKEILKDEYCN